MRFRLELMDWKAVETQALEQIRTANVNIELAETLLVRSTKEIRLLGGKTVVDEEYEAKMKQKHGSTKV